ncbi:MAG: amidohydrolase family protein [Phycisphaerae bacterium]
MIIDIHCHYTLSATAATPGERFSFEPCGAHDAWDVDSCVAPRTLQRVSWRLMRRLLRLAPGAAPGPALDADLARLYERHLFAPGPIERFVLLAFDWYHDPAGRRLPPPRTRFERGSDIYTSNTLIRRLCRKHPDRFLFGASVHPYRENAVACVDEVFSAGACLLKWLPLHQNIDADDPRARAVLRRCAELGLPVLAHYGEEFTLATQHPEHRPARRFIEVLRSLRREGRMPPTIIAHVATPVTPFGEQDSMQATIAALLDEFADAPLYADISALTVWGKVALIRRLARRHELHSKLLFGSDFPVPNADPVLRWMIGPRWRDIARNPSWPQRAALACRHFGFGEIVFHRAAEWLPNVAPR